jgi:hypothetical protein
MNLTSGENMQMNTPARNVGASAGTGNPLPTLTTIAGLAVNAYASNQLIGIDRESAANAPAETIWAEIRSASDVYDFATAKQVVNAGLTNSPLTQNAFLSSAQMAAMQDKYKTGAKVFILRDSSRCYYVPVRTMTTQEQSAVAQIFASCTAR